MMSATRHDRHFKKRYQLVLGITPQRYLGAVVGKLAGCFGRENWGTYCETMPSHRFYLTSADSLTDTHEAASSCHVCERGARNTDVVTKGMVQDGWKLRWHSGPGCILNYGDARFNPRGWHGINNQICRD